MQNKLVEKLNNRKYADPRAEEVKPEEQQIENENEPEEAPEEKEVGKLKKFGMDHPKLTKVFKTIGIAAGGIVLGVAGKALADSRKYEYIDVDTDDQEYEDSSNDLEDSADDAGSDDE